MKINHLLKYLLGSWLRFGVVDDDGGGDDNGEAVGTRNDDRLAMFDQIANSAEQRRSDEFDVENIDRGDDDQQQDSHDDQQTQQAETAAPKIKVNGQEMEITPELIEKAQKIAAADQYLADAARLRREAQTTPNTQRPSEQDASDHRVDDDDVALARALQMGSEEEAVKAIQAIRSQAPSLDRDEIVAAARDAMAMEDAVEWFQKEYDFIWKDPMLTKLAMLRDNELLQAENLTYRQRYEKIGQEISGMVGKKTGFREKEEKKAAAADNVVQVASRRAEPVREVEQEESTQDTIAKMARARGQII